jgi:hypothetical protein
MPCVFSFEDDAAKRIRTREAHARHRITLGA